MQTSLLTTKLYFPPTRQRLVSRPRLVERLETGLRGPLTLISAPAGFGKTTLLSEWVHNCDWCVAWLSLDRSDNDPPRFWPYVIMVRVPADQLASARGAGLTWLSDTRTRRGSD